MPFTFHVINCLPSRVQHARAKHFNTTSNQGNRTVRTIQTLFMVVAAFIRALGESNESVPSQQNKHTIHNPTSSF